MRGFLIMTTLRHAILFHVYSPGSSTVVLITVADAGSANTSGVGLGCRTRALTPSTSVCNAEVCNDEYL
jgi:hypothetical protein